MKTLNTIMGLIINLHYTPNDVSNADCDLLRGLWINHVTDYGKSFLRSWAADNNLCFPSFLNG